MTMRRSRSLRPKATTATSTEKLLTNAQALKYETVFLFVFAFVFRFFPVYSRPDRTRVIRDRRVRPFRRPLPGTFFIDTFTARYH